MRTDEREVAAIAALLARALPAHAGRAIVPLGRGGDHRAYLVGDELVVRVGADDARREAALLAAVAAVAPIAVPAPVLAEDGVLAYPRLPGVPLLGVPAATRAALAAVVGDALGALLHALWSMPAARAAQLVAVDATPLAVWRDEARAHAARFRDALARRDPALGPALDRFVAAPPPPAPVHRVLTHADLGSEHVLVDPARSDRVVTGVIDWSDAAITDPAQDLGRVLRDLGAPGLAAALARCGAALDDVPAAVARAAFYARCMALEDLAYAADADGPAYGAAATDALARLLLADAPAER